MKFGWKVPLLQGNSARAPTTKGRGSNLAERDCSRSEECLLEAQIFNARGHNVECSQHCHTVKVVT